MIFHVHLAMRHQFIILVLITPNPLISFGEQMVAQFTIWYFCLPLSFLPKEMRSHPIHFIMRPIL